MYSHFCKRIKNLLFPALALSAAVGCFTAFAVTIFKLAAHEVAHLSAWLYEAVAEQPLFLPLLILGAALVGLAASYILSYSRSCRGGGIQTSVAAIRGIVSFKWLASIFLLPVSALLTFLCAIPLGTEGPCVQMGTAIGDGVVDRLGGKKQKGWRRYMMTGGASAGFSMATGSPITAVIFAMEELHKHFSPLLLSIASMSVVFAQITEQLLSLLGIGAGSLFTIAHLSALEAKYFFIPLIVGLICGLVAVPFTKLYRITDTMMRKAITKFSVKLIFPLLFALVAMIGFFMLDALGNGHSLAQNLMQGKTVWYLLILLFLIRAILMMVSNTAGVTGGIFLPTLAFGAILGSLCGQILIALDLVDPEHYTLIVTLGIVSFLGANSRIPITACVFAIEALGGMHNVFAVIAAITMAMLAVEAFGLEDFTDTVIKAKIRAISDGKEPHVIEGTLTVKEDSFAAGKELRDILWPNECVVVSFERLDRHSEEAEIAVGDMLTVHYKTFHPAETAKEFEALVGEQSDETKRIMMPDIP